MVTDKDDLSALLAEARQDAIPSVDLTARVLADAAAVHAVPQAAHRPEVVGSAKCWARLAVGPVCRVWRWRGSPD
ncbi:hypothetical protein QTA57_09975 [Fontisubflavum oceani]|uniref:hypothetical protein n=1 Tax=Fontisubflavum oceani TaxID=2978973 RepID=UPI0025B2DC15|nr:hypothetical protein [Fontisubflavum oceani]WJY20215.1 hypothetical protein QTA57_09975 [Fontisubflavum oceani]